MRSHGDHGRPRRPPSGYQLPLALTPVLTRPILQEAERRGLTIDSSASDIDGRLVGEVGGLIAALNGDLATAAAAGVDVVATTHYQDVPPPGRRRCVIRVSMRRIALDVHL